MRGEHKWDTSEQACEDVVIVRSEKISLTERTVPDGIAGLVPFSKNGFYRGVALSDSDPRRSPDVKRESVGRVSGEIGALGGLDSIVTATGSDL